MEKPLGLFVVDLVDTDGVPSTAHLTRITDTRGVAVTVPQLTVLAVVAVVAAPALDMKFASGGAMGGREKYQGRQRFPV